MVDAKDSVAASYLSQQDNIRNVLFSGITLTGITLDGPTITSGTITGSAVVSGIVTSVLGSGTIINKSCFRLWNEL